jgi:hypothetical protein
MTAKNHLADDQQGPSISEDLGCAGDWTVLVVLLHGASLHGSLIATSPKIEPIQSDR